MRNFEWSIAFSLGGLIGDRFCSQSDARNGTAQMLFRVSQHQSIKFFTTWDETTLRFWSRAFLLFSVDFLECFSRGSGFVTALSLEAKRWSRLLRPDRHAKRARRHSARSRRSGKQKTSERAAGVRLNWNDVKGPSSSQRPRSFDREPLADFGLNLPLLKSSSAMRSLSMFEEH